MTKTELVKKVCAGTTQTTLTRAAARDIVDLVFATMTEVIRPSRSNPSHDMLGMMPVTPGAPG